MFKYLELVNVWEQTKCTSYNYVELKLVHAQTIRFLKFYTQIKHFIAYHRGIPSQHKLENLKFSNADPIFLNNIQKNNKCANITFKSETMFFLSNTTLI